MKDDSTRTMPVCKQCGSAHVLFDSYAAWDENDQCYVHVSEHDHTVCENCGGECAVEWVHPDSEEGKRGIAMRDDELPQVNDA